MKESRLRTEHGRACRGANRGSILGLLLLAGLSGLAGCDGRTVFDAIQDTRHRHVQTRVEGHPEHRPDWPRWRVDARVTKPVPLSTVMDAAGKAGGRKCLRDAPSSIGPIDWNLKTARRLASNEVEDQVQPGEVVAFLVECADTLPGEYLIPRGTNGYDLAREKLPMHYQPGSQTIHFRAQLGGSETSKHKAFGEAWGRAMFGIMGFCPEGQFEILQMATGVPEEYRAGTTLPRLQFLHLGIKFRCREHHNSANASDPTQSPHADALPTP